MFLKNILKKAIKWYIREQKLYKNLGTICRQIIVEGNPESILKKFTEEDYQSIHVLQ